MSIHAMEPPPSPMEVTETVEGRERYPIQVRFDLLDMVLVNDVLSVNPREFLAES